MPPRLDVATSSMLSALSTPSTRPPLSMDSLRCSIARQYLSRGTYHGYTSLSRLWDLFRFRQRYCGGPLERASHHREGRYTVNHEPSGDTYTHTGLQIARDCHTDSIVVAEYPNYATSCTTVFYASALGHQGRSG